MSDTKKEKYTPEWFKRGSIYQINPRTFSPEGTINAVTAELPFLAELGFKTMYLCPVFEEDDSTDKAFWSTRQKASQTENPKNPYRMNDYFEIDSEYGTMADLRRFVAESHRLGMKVMLDLVYWHIGPNADVLNIHPEFAKRDENGEIMRTPYNFPVLNFDNEGLREYLWSNMTYYVGAIDVDGFRCDVGDMVPIDFWLEGRRRIRAIKPDAVLLNEGSNWKYLEEGFDASYSFKLHGAIYNAVKHGKPVQEIRKCHEEIYNAAPKDAIMMRDIDNHDTVTDWPERTELAAGHDGMELIEVFNYIIDGIPMVYCGNELGDSALLSMFANRFHMGRFEVTDRSIKNKDFSLRRQAIIKKLNSIKAESDILCNGSTVWLDNSCEDRVVSFARECADGKIVFVGNITPEECTVEIDIANLAGEILVESKNAPKIDGNSLNMPKFSYVVVKI